MLSQHSSNCLVSGASFYLRIVSRKLRTVRLVSKSLAKQVDAQEFDSVPYYVASFPYSVFIILFPLNYGRIRMVGGSAANF